MVNTRLGRHVGAVCHHRTHTQAQREKRLAHGNQPDFRVGKGAGVYVEHKPKTLLKAAGVDAVNQQGNQQ